MQSRFQSYQSSIQSGLQSDYAKSTSSFFSNILTTTTSKYNSLKRQLISSEADGDTEDDSHIARGLRAYYTEKGRAFPPWLPPDPKAPPPPAPTQFVSSSGVNVQQKGYGTQNQQNPTGSGRWNRSGGGLSDLWGDGNRNSSPPGSDSLRQRPSMVSNNSAGSVPTSSQSGRFGSSRFGSGESLQPEPQSRPLPSQRAGSYQSQGSVGGGRFDTASPPPASGVSAQDRLKARLWGAARTASPPPNAASAGSPGNSGSRNPYENTGGGNNSYAKQASGSNSRYGGGPSQDRPLVSSNSPWSGGGDYGGSGGYEQSGVPSGGGLPSGPRSGRQGVGLPNGPRPQRF
ncbi:uncharacterized protein PV09_08455 [Verruconis gallopava]|uniref:Mso1 N-terminal domain-containing protein n=1 Tax=Verruconis gallopava TaxID=253628 RepID=A0A0D1XCC6_9PEZI|nr:uncharacterized protein PV09_08455 [Verruconis gallopava]KIV99935.1 hypothetical protein PV09_08455 [Verruconis gallopava]